MVMKVKWVGIDWGQTFLDGLGQRTYLLIGDTSKDLGEPELVEERCHKWRIMREKYGSYARIKEGHKPEAMNYIFDDHPGAMEMFSATEQRLVKPALGAIEALQYLRDQGIDIAIVTEMKKPLGDISKDMTARFLKDKNLTGYIWEIVTPQGRVDLRDGSVDSRYKGTSKEQGSLYDVLAEELLERGIKTSEAVMIGDKESSDLTPAQKRGFKAIHYIGIIYHGPSNADFTIRHFSELENILVGEKT